MLKAKHIHFIGIGGIGISAIAKMFLERGVNVSGSDSSISVLVEELRQMGAQVFAGHEAQNIPRACDLVVYTNAISQDNVELVEAQGRSIKALSYPEVLGEISKEKFTIAISGNAGKTTTTAMLGQVFIDAGLDPTIIVGSLANFTDRDGQTMRTNFVSGRGQYFIVEADEYKRAFLNLRPKILAINNIEEDHLDYYHDLVDIQNAFREIAGKVPQNGFVVCPAKNKNILPILGSIHATILDYSNVSLSNYSIPLPGEHNRDNARVAIAVARIIGIDEKLIQASLENFKGAWRRFEYKGETRRGALVYDDYAHNPQKIKALIAGTKEAFPEKRIIIVFQPHLFSRTEKMHAELVECFSGIDRLLVVPIYAAREAVNSNITHHALAKAILDNGQVGEVETMDSLDEVFSAIESEGSGAICLTVGAGNIYTVAEKLIS
ncbi:MAG: hypothetical protein COV96_00670 [Candidatus Zambryskibacteria bacterium CG11_big_fil_rev_8_21_14_0_20_42_18]|uniref:UDP-N-acetylmuramate--L-alanine ligase n=1 Tax=Candidatus Zambryskibacteria bacterium CG_4_9_14_3_um_filter_42_15 TaxID=1975112 RepID=A0A2M7WS47_9BACT|nr:MAG: hypothetical protein COV96_00670 [Candidatus Zambryskibacteria bacterium CG11_big_fil_rev_8_21_14_0_20_42_18]PJA32830.1 MAG: hypothetical protein CO185_01535 [Candidatus Zambryskibacteria bacterium CG_4_9_14_3_um_filter_42_15]